MIGKPAVLVEVDDEECVLPVLARANRVVHMLNQHFTGGHVAGRVHGVDGAALRFKVTESRKGALCEIGEELVAVDEVLHGVFLNPFVHECVDDVGFVVVLPGDVGVCEGLENGSCAGGAGYVGEEARGLVGVVDKPTC